MKIAEIVNLIKNNNDNIIIIFPNWIESKIGMMFMKMIIIVITIIIIIIFTSPS